MRRLTHDILWALLTVGLVPLLITAGLGYWYVRRHVEQAAYSDARRLNEQVQHHLTRTLLRVETSAATTRTLLDLPNVDADRVLQEVVRASPAIRSMYLVSATATVAASGPAVPLRGPDRDDQDQNRDLWPEAVRTSSRASQEAHWSAVGTTEATRHSLLQYTLPMGQRTLNTLVPVGRLHQALSKHPELARAQLFIVDQTGLVLADPGHGSQQGRQSLAHLDLVAAALDGQPHTGQFSVGGQAYLGHAAPLAPVGWVLVTGLDRDAALGPARSARNLLLGVLWGALCLALLLATRLAKGIGRPITDLTLQAREIAHGRYDSDLPPQRYAEMQTLRESFGRMADAIRNRESVLRALTRSMATGTGTESLRRITERMYHLFQADLAVLARLHEGRLEPVFVIHQGETVADGAPCELDGVSQLILGSPGPVIRETDDLNKTLQSMQSGLRAGGIVGTVLRAPGGQAIGVLYAVSEARVVVPANAEEVLGLLASRAVVELERKQIERALRHTEAQFQQLAHSIEEVFWLARVADGKVDYISPAFEDIWGISAGVLYRRPWAWLNSVPRDDRRRLLAAHQSAMRSDAADLEPVTFQIQRPDGEVRWIQSRIYPVRETNGPVTHIAGLAVDITDRRLALARERELERRLTDAQKMEALGTLAGGIAHDFNNVLGVIMGFNEMAMMDLDDHVDPRADLEQVQHAAERARQLVQQILSFSRHDESQRGTTALAPLIAETTKLLRASLPSDVQIHTHLDCEPSVEVEVAPTRMHQVLMNLCTNAGYAMAERGGHLSLQLSALNLVADDPALSVGLPGGAYVELRVSDSGTGIDPEVQSRIFEPFFSTKGPGEGTGLGLAVVEGIVRNAGGSISVESSPGRGTSFRILLPQARTTSPKSATPAAEIPQPGSGHGHVLLVDDEVSLVAWARRVLSRLGYEVTSTTSSEDAARMLADETRSFDILVTDQTMPQVSGLDLAVQASLRNIPTVICSGFSTKLTPETMQQAPVATLLHKPLSAHTLASAVAETLAGRAQG